MRDLELRRNSLDKYANQKSSVQKPISRYLVCGGLGMRSGCRFSGIMGSRQISRKVAILTPHATIDIDLIHPIGKQQSLR